MQRCYDRFLAARTSPPGDLLTVVDLGALDVNGSYRSVFPPERFRYVGCDLEAGEGVEVVLTDPYSIPLDDAYADVVVSGQMLEHNERFWLTFGEMLRIMKPNGYLFLIAPSAGPIHAFPVDCYRFYPDAFRALASGAGCRLVDLWLDDRGPWHDLVGVFRHADAEPEPDAAQAAEASARAYRDWLASGIAAGWSSDGAPDAERQGGSVPYLDVLGRLHRELAPRLYLEIGVGAGHSLALAKGPAIGVDPIPRVAVDLPDTARLFEQTSDRFFREGPPASLTGAIDLALIDGLHLVEQSLRDFMHVERHAAPAALVVFDDVFPNHPLQAERRRQSTVWCGDVWKMATVFETTRPDLLVLRLNTKPTGLMLVAGLDPQDRRLREEYNALVRTLAWDETLPVPASVLAREGAMSPYDPRLLDLLRLLRRSRDAGLSHAHFRGRLGAWRAANGL
jgi:SAM-dependent methyltransferase